jgi:hypothetical protein
VGDLARNRLLSLAGSSRFAIGEAEALAGAAQGIFEQKSDHLGVVLNGQALARALIVHGNRKSLKRAEALLRDLPAQLNRLPNAGQIHWAVLLKTRADLAWRYGDQTTWRQIIAQLLTLVRQSGLVHMQHRLSQEYEPTLMTIEMETLSEYRIEHAYFQ